MSVYWKMDGDVAPDPLPGGEHPSAAEAKSILKELAGTYAGDLPLP